MSRLVKVVVSLVPLIWLGAWGSDALALTCTSNAGAVTWNTAANWSCGRVPAAGDSVIIPNGSTVRLNVDTNTLASLQIDLGGTLTIGAGATFDVYLGGNLVNNGSINFTASGSANVIYLAGANVTSTFSGSGTWLLDQIDFNGRNPRACTGTCTVELSGSPNLQFFNASPFAATSAVRTFNTLGNTTATVTYALAGAQTIATANITYPNLVLAGNNNKTPAAGTLNILGSLTVSNGTTYVGTTNDPSVNLAGDFSNNGTFTAGTGVVTFNGAAAQTLGGTTVTTFTDLTIAHTGAGSTTLGINTRVAGNLSVNSGTFDLATFTANRTAAGGTITVANGATLMIGGTNTFPTNYNTHTLGATSTVEYKGANQNVAAEAAPGYGNLTLSGSGIKTAAGSFTVREDLAITGVTFNSGATIQTVNGNVSNTGTHTATTGSITLSGGTAAHVLSGTGTYASLVMNDAFGATLSASPIVSGVLTLTNGIVTTNANVLEVGSSCAAGITRTGGYVLGNLSLHYPTNPGTTTCTFPIGDATAYTPVTVAMTNVSSSLANSILTARTDPGDHPDTPALVSGIDPGKSVNRYWTLTQGASIAFATYNATFTFVNGDIDSGANTANFIVGRKSGGVWTYPTMGAKNPTNTTATGITQANGFGEFAIGERAIPSITVVKSVTTYSDPVNGTTNPKAIPGAEMLYIITMTNSGPGSVDDGKTVITDPISPYTSMCVSNACRNPVMTFTCSASPSCGLTFTLGTSLKYSNNGGVSYGYTPVPDSNGYDSNVTNIQITPAGTFNGASSPQSTNFSVTFKVRIN